VDAYARLDVRLAWRPAGGFELSVVGQNLLEDHHLEFGSAVTSVRATQVQRGVFGAVTWRR
jgi:iron complex outermembrane receptor protein